MIFSTSVIYGIKASELWNQGIETTSITPLLGFGMNIALMQNVCEDLL